MLNRVWSFITFSISSLFVLNALAMDEFKTGITLTEEQHQLLYPSQNPTSLPDHTPQSVDSLQPTALPFFSIELTAKSNPMKNHYLDIDASLQSLTPATGYSQYTYAKHKARFSIRSPFSKALDFSEAIRAKVEHCPEKMLDKMIIDGAVGLNFTW